MPEIPEEEKIDEKTLAVFTKKGYEILHPLGEGNFGMVYKGTAVRNGEPVACKVMNLDKIDARFKDKFVTRELAAMIEAKHKYIIQLIDIFRCNRKVYVFMEFAANGDIMGYCKKCLGGIPLKKAYHWFRQSCEGLYYLHNTLFIAHRDLKLENILLD